MKHGIDIISVFDLCAAVAGEYLGVRRRNVLPAGIEPATTGL
jgi:hypothetical protein